MTANLNTERLILLPLTLDDAAFMIELVNTPGWLQFIGDRQVRTMDAAKGYIEKIKADPAICYWVVKLAGQEIPIGVVTFIKRTYLEHRDIGFAFLPAYGQKGYAYEAASAVLNHLIEKHKLTQILATTALMNGPSIRLLEKLGLTLDKEIQIEGRQLLLYHGHVS